MYDQQATQGLLDGMAEQLRSWLAEHAITEYEIVGIRRGGVWVARALMERLAIEQPLGELDISFYRDDFTQRGLSAAVSPTNLPFATEGKHLILVDDVLMSGRTLRAAMNELFDYGRPESITFATLIDVGQRQLPIAPQVTGANVALAENTRVKLNGPDQLEVKLYT